ncbi:oxidized purine nucleoside triphosphate hydrolase-like [Onthophagus taurus]|uniref:oxidized purine nucleoside triphosphate hydrolase-like n=1 Tax=Onthophagus taurus TaxID=166361 RepID=UPI000C20B4A9|nr:7,8-dihydro-8-oxoguanine triphosphatase-like [Onthophagus taurus]
MSEFNRNPPRKLFTLVFVKSRNRLLLGLKKRGFGVGKWNGFGGKVDQGETVIEGAVRELQEECGLVIPITNLNHLGCIVYKDVDYDREVHIFTTEIKEVKKLNIIESDEMCPKWFNFNEIPYDRMWDDAKHWTNYVLTDTKIGCYVFF